MSDNDFSVSGSFVLKCPAPALRSTKARLLRFTPSNFPRSMATMVIPQATKSVPEMAQPIISASGNPWCSLGELDVSALGRIGIGDICIAESEAVDGNICRRQLFEVNKFKSKHFDTKGKLQ